MPGAGATRSAWMDGVSLIPGDGPLSGDVQADVCIVGAGLAGLTVGYLLAREGRSVIIVDDGPPGMGESLRTTAHLTTAIDDRLHVLAKRFGSAKTRLVVASTEAAIDRIERICLDERLDGVFRRVDGHLFLDPEDDEDSLQKELQAAHEAGLEEVRLESSAPLPWATGQALVFPNQAELDAGEYLSGLADAIRRMGGRIHARTQATDLEEGTPVIVKTLKGRVECSAVVVCTNAPVFGKVSMHTKQEQYRTHVLAYEVPRGWLPRALFWDTGRKGAGYHYVRLCDRAEPGHELLLVGGEDHRTGEENSTQRSALLEAWVKKHFQLEGPVHRWSGQVIEPADHLPFLGRYPGRGKNVYVITGDSGQGFTNHTIGAMLVTDLIQGRRNPWQGLYSPSRQGLTGLFARLRSNTEGASELVKGKLGKGEVQDEADIPAGSGAIVSRDGVKVACYREPSGDLRECAAECTHMGAIVQWNDLEKTWDCPWHGSRFTPRGLAINGPANKPLDPPASKDDKDGPERPRSKRPKAGSKGRKQPAKARSVPKPANDLRGRPARKARARAGGGKGASEPPATPRDTGHGETATGATWQRMHRTEP